METLQIGTGRAAPGEHDVGWIDVAQRASGETLRLAVHVVNGAESGPTLGLFGTSHGDETVGVEIMRHVVDAVDPGRLKGALAVMPVGNPVAFESFTRTTGQGMNTDKNNLNREFPGDEGGWLTEQIAHAISAQYVPKLDYLIDFHSGGLETALDYILVEEPQSDVDEEGFTLAKLCGTEILFMMPGRAHSGTLTQYARSQGIPSVIAELGGCVASDAAYIQRSVRGIRNVMIHLGMIDGQVELPSRQYLLHRRTLLRPKNGGLFIPEVGFDRLAKTVPGGTTLCRVICPHTFKELETIEAPYDPTLLIMMRGVTSRVNPGDYGYILGDWNSAEPIEMNGGDLGR